MNDQIGGKVGAKVGDKVAFDFVSKLTGKNYSLSGVVFSITGDDAVIKVRAARRMWGSQPHPSGHLQAKLSSITAILEGPRSATSHSDKGLATIEAMGTKAEDWGLAEIRWTKVLRTVEAWAPCPICHGDGRTGIVEGKVVDGCTAWNSQAHKTIKVCGHCPKVAFTKAGRMYRTRDMAPQNESHEGHHGAAHDMNYHEMNGLVREKMIIEVKVGIVQWAEGTKFDSRFNRGYGECDLCGKPIPSQRFVPVTGKGSDGVIHGMWVGEDCARKFFGIKNFKEDQVIERPGVK